MPTPPLHTKLHGILLNAMAFLFFAHGVLYFLFPFEVRNETSPIKAIKYLLLAVIVVLTLDVRSFSRWLVYMAAMVMLAGLYFLGVSETSLINIVQYGAPLSVLVYHRQLDGLQFRRIAWATLLLSSVLTYVEVMVLGGIYRAYMVEGFYRASSIFVSPNVLSPMVALLTYLVLDLRTTTLRQNVTALLLVANLFAVTVLSGSKTGLAAAGLVVAAYLLRIDVPTRIRAGLLTSLLVAMAALAHALGIISLDPLIALIPGQETGKPTREWSLETGYIRLREYAVFMQLAVRWPFHPWFRDYMYVDNLYLHIWGSFGLFVVLGFITFNMVLLFRCAVQRRYEAGFVLLLFLMMGGSTNFVYLWPLAYIYWYLVAKTLESPRPAVA
jgi:hypothetical protein